MAVQTPLPRLLGGLQDLNTRLLFLLCCLALTLPVLSGMLLYDRLWKPRDAFIAPAYGPGLVRAGEVSADTAADFAGYWFELRYSWMPDTYRKRTAQVLEHTHPRYRELVKSEMEKDGALVSSQKITSILQVYHAEIVPLAQPSPTTVRVRVLAYHTLMYGADLVPTTEISLDILVTALGMGTTKAALVTANTTGLPPIVPKPTTKVKG